MISFQLLLTAGGYTENILHFTIGGDSSEIHGDRNPGLWTYKDNMILISAIDGDANYLFTPAALSLNTWHSIEISQLSDGSEVFY